jgi:hypothetical protein
LPGTRQVPSLRLEPEARRRNSDLQILNMKTPDRKIVSLDLIKVVNAGKGMPAYLFSKKFEHHLFFDADITTSDELICAIREMVLRGVGPLLPFAVFSSDTREILGIVEQKEDWPKRMMDITESMHKRGNYYGYIIVDSSLRWVACQDDPVSWGVFAFDGKNPWDDVSQDVRDCFANKKRIEDLLISESRDDIELVNVFGRDFLFYLIKNYS